MEFCASTSVPGVRYLAEESRPRHERGLWAVAIVMSVLAFVFMFSKMWRRWRDSPVIIAMDERQRAVWDIPFPAITVCPKTKMRATLFNFSQAYDRVKNGQSDPHEKRYLLSRLTSFEDKVFQSCAGNGEFFTETSVIAGPRLSVFEDLSLLCDTSIIENGTDFRNISTIQRIEEYALQKIPMIYMPTFGQDDIPNEEFQPLLTGEGLCYSYNMIPGKLFFSENTFHRLRNYLNYPHVELKWTLDGGYDSTAEIESYPHRALGSGRPTGISFMVRVQKNDLDDLCTETIQGFKFLLHAPHEFPRTAEKAFLAPLDSVMQVSVLPSEVLTSPDMKRYTVQQRQCYFPEERRLAFFQHYTQNNCQVECLANVTLSMCECVAYYMPRVADTPICGGGKMKCIQMAIRRLERLNSGLDKAETIRTCNCLQSCSHIEYVSQRSRTGLNLDKYSRTVSDRDKEWKKWRGLLISIYFRETYFIATRRMELFDVYDLLANAGGLLGLCLGMSVLSLFELFYWLLVRPCVVRRRVAPRGASVQGEVRAKPTFDHLSPLPLYRKY